MTGSKSKLKLRFESDTKHFGGGENGRVKAVEKWEACESLQRSCDSFSERLDFNR